MAPAQAGERPLLSASVVMYGNAEETRVALQSIADHTRLPGFVLYLIDNASPDGALTQLQQQPLPAPVEVVALPENRGYGAGHNAVLNRLTSEFHVVANPDLVLRDDAFVRMARWMQQHPDVAIATPRLEFPDGREQQIAKRRPAVLPLVARQVGFGFLKKYEDHYLMRDEDLSQPTDVEFCSGCCFIIRTEIYQKMGGFDEGYFMYVEDADITAKARQYGRAVFLPDVTVVHAWHRAAHRKPRQFWWQVKSMLRYFKKWGWKWK